VGERAQAGNFSGFRSGRSLNVFVYPYVKITPLCTGLAPTAYHGKVSGPVRTFDPRRNVVSFGLYIAGFVIVIAGLIYGAHLMHLPSHWIVVGTIVLVGLGILSGVKATRQKDPPS
jgi:hypothetical protein